MKQNAIASLAALALLSAGSLAYAAEVTGGNVAVVVQRASVPSASGYQLLCVPVKGLDITGSTEATALTLDQVLPPDAYGVKPTNADTRQCLVTVFGANGMVEAKITATPTTTDEGTTYTYAWTAENGTTAGQTELACGTVLWFYNPADISLTQAAGGGAFSALSQTASASLLAEGEGSKTTQVTFCGQQNGKAQTPIAPEGTGTLKTIGNEKSEAIPLSDLFNDNTCGKGTQVFRIAAPGHANYTIYAKRTSSWTKLLPQGGLEPNFNMTTEMLQPGEAVYYYGVAPAAAN